MLERIKEHAIEKALQTQTSKKDGDKKWKRKYKFKKEGIPQDN